MMKASYSIFSINTYYASLNCLFPPLMSVAMHTPIEHSNATGGHTYYCISIDPKNTYWATSNP